VGRLHHHNLVEDKVDKLLQLSNYLPTRNNTLACAFDSKVDA